jgi:hypothetical protein
MDCSVARDRLDDPLQVMVSLDLPDLHRHPLPLDGLGARIAQTGSLPLHIVAVCSDGSARQFSHAHELTHPFRQDGGFRLAPVFLVGLGFFYLGFVSHR